MVDCWFDRGTFFAITISSSNSSYDQFSHPVFYEIRLNDVPEIIEVMVQLTKYVSKKTNERIRDRDVNSLNMANSNDVKKMLAFFKLQKDSMVEYYKNINYLILLGNQSKINDPQLQVICDRLKKVYPAVIEKNIYLITNSKIYSYPLKKYPRHYSIIRSLLLRRTRSRTK